MIQGTASLQISLLTGGSVIRLYLSSISSMVSPDFTVFFYYTTDIKKNPEIFEKNDSMDFHTVKILFQKFKMSKKGEFLCLPPTNLQEQSKVKREKTHQCDDEKEQHEDPQTGVKEKNAHD